MHFGDRLTAAVEACGNPVLLGIDPHLDLLPDPFAAARDASAPRADRADALARFGCALVDLAAGRVAAVKPQSAFFEQLGADGVAAFERVCDRARERGLLVVGDVKRGDIASTARAYAVAHLDPPGGTGRCDAVTLSPYLGPDSLEPFVEVADAVGGGVFVLVRTSNPGGSAWQQHGEPQLAELVAARLASWGAERRGASELSGIGAVVGATHPGELAAWRERMPHAPLLLPGFGAQGATAADVVDAFLPGGRGALVASSRGIAFAHRDPKHAGASWEQAASDALDAMAASLRDALSNR